LRRRNQDVEVKALRLHRCRLLPSAIAVSDQFRAFAPGIEGFGAFPQDQPAAERFQATRVIRRRLAQMLALSNFLICLTLPRLGAKKPPNAPSAFIARFLMARVTAFVARRCSFAAGDRELLRALRAAADLDANIINDEN
jgi:hypothetical protein